MNPRAAMKPVSLPWLRNLPSWALIGVLRSLAILPHQLQRSMGLVLGWWMYFAMRRRQKIADRNIELCLPTLSKTARARMVRQHFSSLGLAIMESALAWWGPVQRLDKIGRINGLEHLTAAQARGHGVIVVSGHFTTVDICMQIMSRRVACHAIYRRNKNPILEAQIYQGRIRNGAKLFERENMRTAIKALRDNQIVWFSPDQDHGLAMHGEFVPFFGIPSATVTTTARMAAHTGAAVVPLVYRRLPGGRGYEMCLLPALDGFPETDLVHATRRINAIIESHILVAPDQYLWVHRRFKTRPPGELPVYEQ